MKDSSLGGRIGRLDMGEGGGGAAEVEGLEFWGMLDAWRWGHWRRDWQVGHSHWERREERALLMR